MRLVRIIKILIRLNLLPHVFQKFSHDIHRHIIISSGLNANHWGKWAERLIAIYCHMHTSKYINTWQYAAVASLP